MRCAMAILTVGAAGAAFAAVPTTAHACSCVGSTPVANRDTIAANHGLVVGDFCGGDRDGLQIEIDGAPASLVGAPDIQGWGDAFVVQLDPQPQVGQTISVTYGWQDAARSLVVVEPDTEAPPAPEISVEVIEDAEVGCFDIVPFGVRVDVATNPDYEPDVWFDVTVTADGQPLLSRGLANFFDADELGFTEAQEEDFDSVREVCVEVVARDAAGNASEAVSNCAEGPQAESCACTSNGNPGPGSGAALLLTAFALIRRRRTGPAELS